MTDLVERLRSDGEDERQRFRESRCTLAPLLNEAAAEIERLRAEGDKARSRGDKLRMALEDIAYGNPLHNEDDLMRIARAALEEPK